MEASIITISNPAEEPTFETVSKNIKAWPHTIHYTGGVVTSVVYTQGTQEIVKTFTYTSGNLTRISLSGDTPHGIALTKTLEYTGDNLTSVEYS